jgi:hypothetical protein
MLVAAEKAVEQRVEHQSESAWPQRQRGAFSRPRGAAR